MNKACEYCQYNCPYGSIINPCENCHNNDFRTATTTTTTDMKTLQISYGKNTGDVDIRKYMRDLYCYKFGGVI